MLISIITFAIIIILSSLRSFAFGEDCGRIKCSYVFDPVCGLLKTSEDIRIIRKYQNSCHLKKARCEMQFFKDKGLRQIPDILCNIKKTSGGRRVNDFSIVGAYQACNHTCPTYCIDTYEPLCAQIWRPGMGRYSYRPMINHCHIDLFSCVMAVNVTIHPLGKCFKNPGGLAFMSQIAALKSLHLLDDSTG